MIDLIRDYGLILLFFVLPILFVLEPFFFSNAGSLDQKDEFSFLNTIFVFDISPSNFSKFLINSRQADL